MKKMRSNKGMGHIQLVITIVIILLIVISAGYFVYSKYNEAKIETLKTNMLLIKWKVKEKENTKTAAGEKKEFIGTKISEINGEIDISEFLSKNVIQEDQYEKYYVLTDDNLNQLGVSVSNEKNAYYIINYETNDILITKGCSYLNGKTVYKLSDIELAKEELDNKNKKEENVEEENTDEEDKSNLENKEE